MCNEGRNEVYFSYLKKTQGKNQWLDSWDNWLVIVNQMPELTYKNGFWLVINFMFDEI